MNSRSPITTHVLDTALGRPAHGVPVILEVQNEDGSFHRLAEGITNSDGRISDLLAPDTQLKSGIYRVTFDTGTYYTATGQTNNFYPEVAILFFLHDPTRHHHIPLLLSPFGYTTYRGS